MKQFISSILMMMYLTLNLGLSLQAHYCLGELRSVTIQNAESACPCPHQAPCCEDILADFSLDEDHTYSPAQALNLNFLSFALPVIQTEELQEVVVNEETQFLKLCNHSPPQPDIPLYLSYQSRLIYG